MPWVSKKVLGQLQETERKLWRTNRELLHLILRSKNPVLRAAVNEEGQMEAIQVEAEARAAAVRTEGDDRRRVRMNGPAPSDIDLEYDETQGIGGPE